MEKFFQEKNQYLSKIIMKHQDGLRLELQKIVDFGVGLNAKTILFVLDRPKESVHPNLFQKHRHQNKLKMQKDLVYHSYTS